MAASANIIPARINPWPPEPLNLNSFFHYSSPPVENSSMILSYSAVYSGSTE